MEGVLFAAKAGSPQRRTAPFREWSPSVHYAQYQRLPPGSLPERRIYDFELLYVVQGEAATYMHGQRYRLEAGQLIFLPAGVTHRNEVVSSPEARFLGIHFDFFGELEIQTEADMVVNEAAVQPHKFTAEACAEGLPPLSARTVYAPPLACVQLMEQLVHEFAMRPAGYELVCKGLMLQILAHLLRVPQPGGAPGVSLHGGKLAGLIERIEAAPEDGWTNRSIARQMNLSVDHTAKLFKQMTGLPPGEFVQSVRHREARRLLRETELPVEGVGERVGYPDIHYFSRMFRRHEGVSPREYRKLSKML